MPPPSAEIGPNRLSPFRLQKLVCMYVCKSLFKHGKSSLKLKLKLKLITTALHDCRVGIRYISYLLDISLKITDAA